jgi:hypothetical protein
MTYLFKLARRTARGRALVLTTLAALTACDTDQLTSNTEDVPATPAAELTPTPAPLFATSFRGGIPFGTWALPTNVFGDVFNGAVRNIYPNELLEQLAAIKARGGRIVLAMAGNEENFKDRDGHFSLSMWKARVDRFKAVDFSSYIDDGTIIGHYMIDEPNDPVNWTGKPVPGPTLEAMAAYSKQLWPKMATVIRVEPGYLATWGSIYRNVDAAWAQWVTRKGDPADYIRQQVADAGKLGLSLITGLNIRKGGPEKTPLSASVVQSAGSALLANDYPCAFISWEYNEQYLSRSDIKTAMTNLSGKAEAHAARTCSKRPTSLPSTRGVVLTAVKVLVDGEQIVNLTWSGAAGDPVDLYINGKYRRSTPNDGRTKVYPHRAGQYTYKICEAGETRCSNSASITIK